MFQAFSMPVITAISMLSVNANAFAERSQSGDGQVDCKIIEWDLSNSQSEPVQIIRSCKLTIDRAFGLSGECPFSGFGIDARAEVIRGKVDHLIVTAGELTVETDNDYLHLRSVRTNRHYLVACTVRNGRSF